MSNQPVEALVRKICVSVLLEFNVTTPFGDKLDSILASPSGKSLVDQLRKGVGRGTCSVSAINTLRLIDTELGTVNFSSHKQMKEAIEGAQSIAQAYLETFDNWQPISTAPKDGSTIEVSYNEDGSEPEFAMWSERPVCMGGPTVYNKPGWATAMESNTDTNLPMDEPSVWRYPLSPETPVPASSENKIDVPALAEKEEIDVIEVNRIRDGGTTIYEDEFHRRYFQWYPTKKVYNQWPFPHGNIGTNDVPPEFVKEIPIRLNVVSDFNAVNKIINKEGEK